MVVKPELLRIGQSASPLVVVDDASGDVGSLVEIAAALAPFPAASGSYYPGQRRFITPADRAAYAYVERLCERISPFIGGAFDCDGFDLVEASFSLVTTPPGALLGPQRAPHFDSTDPRYLAVLHYLNVPAGSGTAFFRQRATGIEQVTAHNLPDFVRTAERDAALRARTAGYIAGSDPHYEELARVEAVPDRLLIYQGSLLHSGIIPEDMIFSPEPRRGRLTANLFVRAH